MLTFNFHFCILISCFCECLKTWRLFFLYKQSLASTFFSLCRKLEEVQADLSTSTQKWHSLNNKHESAMREKEREIEGLNSQLEDTKNSLTGDLQDVVS